MPRCNATVFGLGYVGCVTAACLADLGHCVVGVDSDDLKVRCIKEGRAPFYEPGLEDVVKANVANGRLKACSTTEDALREAAIVLICVGTPPEKDGNVNLRYLKKVLTEIAAELQKHPRPVVIAIRSTVFPGTCADIALPVFAKIPCVTVVSNPEFLREGSAVRDFNEPPLTVVGGDCAKSVEMVARLYEDLDVPIHLVTSRTAEMVKYACNAFHAAKISFANEIGALCENLSIPAREVVKILCSDTTLNISPAYMQPGFAFGGSCLTKDLRAVRYRASECGLKLPLLESLTESNHAQIERALRKAEEFHGRIGVIGLAFKENTDDVRESAAVILVEALIRKRRVLRVWDPHISMTSIYGRNREYILTRIPLIETLLVPTLADLIAWNPDCLIVTQKLSKSIRGSLLSSGKLILDLARLDLDT